MMNRLNNLATLKIDPNRKISFVYRDKRYFGLEGDTIASAL
jgi:sarcosine oxidase subunit alpha